MNLKSLVEKVSRRKLQRGNLVSRFFRLVAWIFVVRWLDGILGQKARR